ncbi:PQQ-binding-like beta-propeller repeat protein [Myxococcus landrumensis]|uniref:PQQ-binding-like beta-propeller repeat protein n=2 Tax=Myxococcus landrumensis TaxID=2813577 RepID=A0ABX7NH76_9BACT|nr:PQQ-binding-like beta-propeller repeat protein [Myxococcus landrumus]
MTPVNARLAVLLAALALSPAVMAQTTMNRTAVFTALAGPGETQATVTMDEASELRVQVRNNTSSSSPNYRPINEVIFQLPGGYTLLESPPPPGWAAEQFTTAGYVRYFYIPSVQCAGPAVGLAMNETQTFTLRMIPPVSNTNAANQQFATLEANEQCSWNGGFSTNRTSTAARWLRAGLSTQVSIQPRALPVGEDFTARLVIENRTGQSTAQANISAEGPSTGAGGVTFEVVELEPTNFRVSIPLRGAGILAARATVQSEGTMVASARATNTGGSVTSSVVDTPMVTVGALAAAADVDVTQAFTGEAVKVRLSVTNTSATASYLDVVPRAPVLVGAAQATLTQGPSPASTPRLAPGASAHFVWLYTLTGAEFSDYAFDVSADATLNGAAVSTPLVRTGRGRIVAHRLKVSPSVLVPGVANQTVLYTVQNRGSQPIYQVTLLRPATNYFRFATGSPASAAGWSVSSNAASFTWTVANGQPIGVNQERSFPVTYASVSPVTAPTTFRHRMHLPDVYDSQSAARIEAPVTLAGGSAAPEVERLTAVARDGSVTLAWDNPSSHNGVLVLRAAGSAPNTPPVAGQAYAQGATLGNATVVLSETFTSTSTFVDSTVANGTTYYYRVFNSDDAGFYSAGNQPTSAALKATPRARVGAAPLWCYSVGLDARIQPITELGVGIFSSFNNTLVANLTQAANPATDGAERWRPLQLGAPIGSRFPVVPLRGLPGQYILTADQDGVAYAISAATGTVLWRWNNNGTPIGTIQSFPVTQLHDYANAAYQAARPNLDLVFFATRLSNPAANRVVALNARTGTPVFTYQPGDLGMVNGGMVVDYVNNLLFIGGKVNGVSADSLRVLNTLTGAEVARLALGDLEHSLVRNGVTGHILATNSDGVVHAVDAVTRQVVWSLNVATRPAPSTPAFTSFVRPLGGGFVASLASGLVEFWDYAAPGAATPTRQWSTAVPNPSGTFTLNRNGVVRIYVGGGDGKVHQLEMVGGVDSAQVTLTNGPRIGTPTIDTTSSRLHVGSEDGLICSFPVPFP